MKLFQLILSISIIFISACSTFETRSVKTPSKGFISVMPEPFFDEKTLGRYADMTHGWYIFQYLGFNLSTEDKKKHKTTVMFALENIPDMKVASWYNKKKITMGKVRVIESYSLSGGYCRYYQVLIQKKQAAKTAVYLACKEDWLPNWGFNYGSHIGQKY